MRMARKCDRHGRGRDNARHQNLGPFGDQSKQRLAAKLDLGRSERKAGRRRRIAAQGS
jgi:hypothetical protein